jgi:lipoprotein
MKRLLTSLSVVFMMCLVLVACKKDDNNSYPATIESSVWSGANSSTGYTCDVVFTVSGSVGDYCDITITSPSNEDLINGQGHFTYDASVGTIKVTFDNPADGAPSGATLQFNEAGNVLTVSLTGTIEYPKYDVTKVNFPASVAGKWAGTGSDKDGKAATISANIDTKAINEGQVCTITTQVTGLQAKTMTGTCSYTKDTGKVVFKVAVEGEETQTYEFKLSPDGKMKGEIDGFTYTLAKGK